MKILIIDSKRHEELEFALKEYDITLEQEKYIPEELEEGSYALIVLCPENVKDLRCFFDKLILRRINPVILYENTDDRFINICTRLGCVDVVKTPYRPELLAKRLWSVMEGLSLAKGSRDVREELEIHIKAEDFIKREIKKADRMQIPIGFIAFSCTEGAFLQEEAAEVLSKLKECIRDTDFVTIYGDIVVVMLPGCRQKQLKIVEKKLLDSVHEKNICVFDLVKEKFYSKNPIDDFKEITGKLKTGLEDALHSSSYSSLNSMK